jgi:hypothetical protein
VQTILTPYYPCLSDMISLEPAHPVCSQASEHLSVAIPVLKRMVETTIRTSRYQV